MKSKHSGPAIVYSPERTGLTIPLPRRSWLDRLLHLWVLLYFSVFSLVMTWPLALKMANSVVGEIGDNIYFIFLIRWYQRAWLELGISPFFHPWLNYPQGWNLASTDTSLATTLFGLPASLLFGPTFGFNFAMLVTFVLSGWAMFYWVRRLTSSVAAGLVAGTIYAFLPSRMAHFLIGHLNLSGTEWFPLYFMGLYDLLRSLREAANLRALRRPLLITALSLGLIGFTSMYYLLMTGVISVVFVLAYLLLVDRACLREGAYWRRLLVRFGVLGVASLPLVILSILPFLSLDRQGGLATRAAGYASMYSASPTDFILPSTDHFLFGAWVGAHFDRSLWIEGTFYIGVVALALVVLAWTRRSESRHAGLIKVSVLVMAAAFILALGTDLHWNNQRVMVPLPAILQGILHRESAPIPLPALLLFHYLPFYAKMRSLMRIGFFVLIFSSMLAGLGSAWLFRKAGKRRVAPLAALLIALVFVDFYPGPYQSFAVVEARPVDLWLAQQPGSGAVAQFPFAQEEDQTQVFYTLTHQKPYIGGFFSANQPSQYLEIRPVLNGFPSAEGLALLRQLGVRWVLFDTAAYSNFSQVRQQVKSLGLVEAGQFGDQVVYELAP